MTHITQNDAELILRVVFPPRSKDTGLPDSRIILGVPELRSRSVRFALIACLSELVN